MKAGLFVLQVVRVFAVVMTLAIRPSVVKADKQNLFCAELNSQADSSKARIAAPRYNAGFKADPV